MSNLVSHIHSNLTIADAAFLLRFDKTFEFKAGQTISIAINDGDIPRLYSIASPPGAPYFEIIFKIKDGGYNTPQMAQLKPSDAIYVDGPFGNFIGTDEPAWYIATGTGVAPFHSMLYSIETNNKVLLHGVRSITELHFFAEFKHLLGDSYIPVISGGDVANNEISGRVTDVIKRCYTGELKYNWNENTKFFLCGNPRMVFDVNKLLLELGIHRKNILTESYL